MKSLGLVVMLAATFARADTTDPFSYPHAKPGPTADPFRYPHGLPSGYAVSAEAIAKYAPPPLDPVIAREVQASVDQRGIAFGTMASRGDRMFFTWKITGTSQVWRQDGPGAWPVQMTAGEDATTIAAIAPDDSYVVVSRDVGGGENPGLYVMAAGGGALHVIQHVVNVQTELQYISEDSGSVFYRANDRDPASYAIYRFDVKTGVKELMFDVPGVWSVADHRDGEWLMKKSVGELQTEIYRYELATKKLIAVLGVGESEHYEAMYGAKGLVVSTDKLGDSTRLYTFDGELKRFGEAENVVAFTIDRARTRVFYDVSVDGHRRAAALDARTGKAIALPALPAADQQYMAGQSWNGRYVVFGVNGATVAPTTLVWDWKTKKLVEWHPAATPEVDLATYAKAELETFIARDGVKIPMFVRRPAACMNAACPVIVEFHGGPEGQATPQFSPTDQLFVAHGFVVVQPNVRGSAGYGKAWLHADDGVKRLDVVTDIEDCALYLRKTWAVTKIGVTGSSYGGYSVLMAMTRFAGAYDAGVEQVGMSNLVTFLDNTAPYRRALRISEYGDPMKDKVALEKLSPISYIDQLKAPLLIFGGVNDPRVPVGEGLQFREAMEARKIDGGLILFPDEGHGSQKRANVVMTVGHALEFFERHLK